MKEQFKLNQLEVQTPVWQRVSKELAERLEVLRELNDGDHGAIKTAELRGRIAVIKMILEWEKPRPVILSPD